MKKFTITAVIVLALWNFLLSYRLFEAEVTNRQLIKAYLNIRDELRAFEAFSIQLHTQELKDIRSLKQGAQKSELVKPETNLNKHEL